MVKCKHVMDLSWFAVLCYFDMPADMINKNRLKSISIFTSQVSHFSVTASSHRGCALDLQSSKYPSVVISKVVRIDTFLLFFVSVLKLLSRLDMILISDMLTSYDCLLNEIKVI